MYCEKCGFKSNDEDNFCRSCGNKYIKKPASVLIEDPIKVLDDTIKKIEKIERRQNANYKTAIKYVVIFGAVLFSVAIVITIIEQYQRNRYSSPEWEQERLVELKKQSGTETYEDIIANGGDVYKEVTYFEFDRQAISALEKSNIDVKKYQQKINEDISKGGEIKNARLLHTCNLLDSLTRRTYYSNWLFSQRALTNSELLNSYGQ